MYYNESALNASDYLEKNSVDLIITDPPYGIEGDKLHKHYNRDESFASEGYIEIPLKEYAEFSEKWISETEKIMKPGASMYIVSGYTNLIHILNALNKTNLVEVNHLIWKYNFGVYTQKKYVSSHYHILYYVKKGGEVTFNKHCRYGESEKNENGGNINYLDREDVWLINREYKRGQFKNKNELPYALLTKMLQYSSNENDMVCDLFLGGFSTAKAAIGMNRKACGFELNKIAFKKGVEKMKSVEKGYLLSSLKKPEENSVAKNRNKKWSEEEEERLINRYKQLKEKGTRGIVDILCKEFERGRFGITGKVKRLEDNF